MLQEGLRRLPCEGGMVRKGADKARAGTHFHAILRGERGGGGEAAERVADGYGIVQRPEGVDADPEAVVGQAAAGFIGEAAADREDAVVLGEESGGGAEPDRRLESDGHGHPFFVR